MIGATGGCDRSHND